MTDDYRSIVVGDISVIDVRSPAEFSRGAVSNSRNLPILDNAEREQVGIIYRTKGRQAAITRGHELVAGETKLRRIQSWVEVCDHDPNSVLCCWRGGLRSSIAQKWLVENRRNVACVEGGYKSLRRYTQKVLESVANRNVVVLGGRTGTGKTVLLREFSNAIDLEDLARHRGSAFGGLNEAQPMPQNFDFSLAAELLRTESQQFLLAEDESRMIGKLHLPPGLFDSMVRAPLVVLDAPMEQRIEFTYENYVIGQDYAQLRNSLQRIEKRLGGVNYKSISESMSTAMKSDKASDHSKWIKRLLEDYYDPMYDYQLSKKQNRIVFQGNTREVREFLRSHYSGK